MYFVYTVFAEVHPQDGPAPESLQHRREQRFQPGWNTQEAREKLQSQVRQTADFFF